MNGIESFGPTAATMGGGFILGILIGYALKKVIRIVAVIAGLFLAGLAFLQYHQVANINWNKLQTVSEGVLTTVANLTMQIQGISSVSGDGHAAATASSSLAMTSFGISLTGSMSAGFTIGFMKG
ncbi:MAG TPA: FUN14 domain-containing protein [Nitrososphaeraceae archaeon]|nr:FUN14 domain-containing protein [Nitrososphaeraceae archaeon]